MSPCRLIAVLSLLIGWQGVASAQSNDDFSQRLALSGPKATAVSNNLHATKQAGEPNHAASALGRSLWWTWTAPSAGMVNISTFAGAAASAPPRTLAVYTGDALASLTEVASSNGFASSYSYSSDAQNALARKGTSLNVAVAAGATYQIAVDASSVYLGVDDGTVVLAIGAAPTVVSEATVNANTGVAFSYSIVASNDPTSYAATNLPTGLAVNPFTGVISGTPMAAGVFNIGVSATGAGGTGAATLTLQVTDPAPAAPTAPLIYSAAGAGGYVGRTFSYYIYASGSPTSYTAGTLPPGLTSSGSSISGTPTAAGTYVVPLSATNSLGTANASVTINIAAALPPVLIVSDIAASATAGSYFSYYISTQRGDFNDTSTITYAASALPPGIALDANGDLSGTPTQVGVYPATVSATNAGGTRTAIVTITVSNPAPAVASASPPQLRSVASATGAVGAAFSYTLAASNTPTAFSASGLPPGLSLNASTGVIAGTPTAAGSYAAPVSASNSYGVSNATLTIAIVPSGTSQTGALLPLITSPAAVSGSIGQGLTYNIAALYSDYEYPYFYGSGTWTFAATGLPPGMNLVIPSNGYNGSVIGGTPTSAGTYPVKLTATYSSPYSYPTQAPASTTATVTFYIGAAVPPAPATVNGSATQSGAVGTAFSFTPSYGNAPTSFSASGLPPGLSISATNGAIAGTPTAAGNYQVTVSAGNSAGTGSTSFKFVIAAQSAPVIASGASAAGTLGSSFSYSISAGSGVTGYTASNLPAGLSFNAASGVISGKPTSIGTFFVPISATNAAGTANATVTITISSTASTLPIITSAASAAATVGQDFYYSLYASDSVTGYTATSLPPGLSFSSGSISGLPSAPGVYNVPLTATNGAGTSRATLTIVVNALGAPVLSTYSVYYATVNQGGGLSVSATNSPTSFTASGLPSGLSIDPSSGYVSGAPTATGTYPVGLSATNSAGTGHATLTVIVQPAAPPAAPLITSQAGAAGAVGVPFGYAVAASGSPTSYAISSLPPGLGFSSSTGVLSGTPTAAGNYAPTISATNAAGTANATLSLRIFTDTARPPLITSAAGALATYDSPFNYAVIANGPATFTASGLPTGLSIDAASGVISGRPTGASGNYAVTLSAANGAGINQATLTINLANRISPPHLISAAAASATVGQAFSYTAAASTSYTFTATGLPSGLVLNAQTGVISGTPSSASPNPAVVSFTTDGGYGVASGKVSIWFNGAATLPVVTSPSGVGGYLAVPLTYAVTATNSPRSFSAAGLPAGLAINATTGLITGSPVSPGSSVATITVSGDGGTSTAVVSFNIGVAPSTVAQVASPADILMFTGVPFRQALLVAPTTDSFQTTLFSSLPSGVGFDFYSQTFSGVPRTAGTYPVTLGTSNYSAQATAQLRLIVVAPPANLPVMLQQAETSGAVGGALSFTAYATNSPTVLTASNLPPGLAFNTATGVVSGTPTTAGAYAVSFTAANSAGQGTATTMFVIAPAPTTPPTILSGTPLTDTYALGVQRSTAIQAGNVPLSYSASGLPPGLTLNATTGVISGAATSAGEYPATITVLNSYGSASSVITFEVTAALPEFTNLPAGATGVAGVAFGNTLLSTTNAGGSYTASGLPSGLTLNSTSGVISGTPTTPGVYPVALSATNLSGTRTVVWTLTVKDPQSLPPVFGSYYPAETVFVSGQASSYYLNVSTSNYQSGNVSLPLTFSYSGLPAGISGPATSADSSYLSGTPTVVGQYPVTVTATAAGGATASEIVNILVVPPSAGIITSLARVDGSVGSPLSYSLYANGSVSNYSAANLPSGLTLNPSYGAVSGTPSTSGTFPVSVSASGPAGTTTATVTFVIAAPAFGGLPLITSAASAAAQYFSGTYSPYTGAAQLGLFAYKIRAINGPTSFGAQNLPAGLSLNSATGDITGSPVADGVYSVPISATNAAGTSSATLTVIAAATYPALSASLVATGSIGTSFYDPLQSASVTTTDYSSPNAPRFAAAGLPPGLSVNTLTGVISGDPTQPGTYSVAVSATNREGSDRAVITIIIGSTPPVSTPTIPLLYSDAMAVGYVGVPLSYSLTAAGATSYAASGLPAGLSVNPVTGVISGTPAATGVFSVPVTVSNAAGAVQAVLTVAIDATLPGTYVSSAAGATAYVGAAFSYFIYPRYSITPLTPTGYSAGALPPGLYLNTQTGLISGTPSGPAGVSTVPIAILFGAASCQAELNLTVAPPLPLTVPAFSSPAGVFGLLDNPLRYSLGTRFAPTASLPPGLTFDPATGVIFGLPTTVGVSSIPLASTGDGPSGAANLTLNVTAPDFSLPFITISPTSGTVSQNGSVTLTAAAVGAPAPAFQWTHNGAPIAGATSPTLTIAGAQPADGGLYALTATNVAGRSVSASASLLVQQSFGTWQAAHFTAAEINAGLAGDKVDFSGDGVVNLLKYALGLDPRTNARGGGLPTARYSPADAAFVFSFTRDAGRTDLVYVVENTIDLSHWTPIASSSQGNPTANLGALSVVEGTSSSSSQVNVTVRSTTPTGAAEFFRLRINRGARSP